MFLAEVDLTALDLFEEGLADDMFATLRKQAPIYWQRISNSQGFWALTRYRDIVRAWKDPGTFSSEYGIMLRLRDRKDPASGKMMVVTDPPRHTRLRSILNRGFAPRQIAQLDSKLRSFVSELLEDLPVGVQVDFALQVAARLSVTVNMDLIGIAREDWAEIAQLTVASFAAEDPEFWTDGSSTRTSATANFRLMSYLLSHAKARRADPRDDLISLLVSSSIGGESLSDEEVALNCINLLIGGNETTRYAATGGMLALIEHPEQAGILQQHPDLVANAVEEILRWTTPNIHVLRTVTRATEFDGTPMHAGQLISLWTGSANRDEAIFENASRFDVLRNPNRHVAFGVGPHNCLGSSLARRELQILFEEIAKRRWRFAVAGAVPRLRSNFLAGYKHLPVLIDR